jgi:hypothetical protein
MRGLSVGKLIVSILLIAAILMGWWAVGTRRTRAAGPPMVYSGPDGRAEDVTGSLAIVDVTVITMARNGVHPRHTVLVVDGEISAVGPVRSTSFPAAAHRVDGRGRYLLPLRGAEPFRRIAVGQRSDMVLLDGNPLEDVASFERRSGVIVRGRWISEARIQQLMREQGLSFEELVLGQEERPRDE